MPILLSPPQVMQVQCDTCGAIIGYHAHEVERHSGRDYGGGPDGYERVKCPGMLAQRDMLSAARHIPCAGYGYIRRW